MSMLDVIAKGVKRRLQKASDLSNPPRKDKHKTKWPLPRTQLEASSLDRIKMTKKQLEFDRKN